MWIKDTIKRLDRKYLNSFLFRRLNTRRIHLYCTGSLKSGTHSISRIFEKNFRSRHEPNNDELVKLYLRLNKEDLTKNKLETIALKREKRLYLEVNSSSFNYIILDQLLKLYPKAKFIHTIREPRAWLDSWINHYINHYINDETIQAIPIEN